MQLGIHFVNFTLPGAPASLARTLAETARIAEDGGATTFTVMDHWFQMEMMASLFQANAPAPAHATYLIALGFVATRAQPMTR